MGVAANNSPFYALKNGSRQIRFQKIIPRDANLHIAFGETATYDDRLRTEDGYVNFAPRKIIPDNTGSGKVVSENYPFDESLDADIKESNVSRRARGVSLDSQNTHYMIVASAGGRGRSQPTPLFFPTDPFGAVYPYNSVRETESGHLFEADDTPGRERIKESHRIGTYYEVYPDGTKVTRVVGDDYAVTVKDKAVHIQGACYVTVENDCSLYVKGDFTQQVDGDYNLSVGKNYRVSVNGNKSSFKSKAENHFEHITGSKQEVYGGNHDQEVGGNQVIKVGSPFSALFGASGKRSILAMYSEHKAVRVGKTTVVGGTNKSEAGVHETDSLQWSRVTSQIYHSIGCGPLGVTTATISLSPASVSTVAPYVVGTGISYAALSSPAVLTLLGGVVSIN